MVVVVRANFLNQFVVGAVERYEDADYFERLRAQPGNVTLGLFLVARFGRVEVAKCILSSLLDLFVLNAAVERLGILGIDDRLLRGHVELHYFCRRDQANRDIALARGVVPKVDAESAVSVVDDLPRYEKVELDGLDIGMEVPPAEHLLELAGLDHRPPFGSRSRVLEISGVPQPVP